jgi:HEAT repeat protein
MIARPYFKIKACLAGTVLALLALACAATAAQAATPTTPDSLGGLASLQYSGSQDAVNTLRQAISDAGKDVSKLPAIEAELVRLLGRPDLTYAGRQAICENLGKLYSVTFARGEQPVPPVLVTMLADGTQVDLARLALERAPGATVDAVFVAGLAQSSGRVRIALIQSIGNRRIASEVPALEALTGDADVAVSTAAVRALGQIGTAEAALALEKAPNPTSAVVVEARIRCARVLGKPEDAKTLEELFGNVSIAPPLRASALSALIFLDPGSAAKRVADVLAGSDPILKQSVLSWIVALPRPSVIPVITANFGSWDLATQTAVIVAAGRMGDPALLPLVTSSALSEDVGLHRAAIESLGELPGSADVALLLAKESQAPGEAGSAAKQSLARLDGPGVDNAVLDGARQTENPLRNVFLEELALRNAIGAAGIFMAVRSEADVKVRCIALDGLSLVATPDLEAPLLKWMITATDPTEQSHALRAAAAATFRNPDENARLKPIADLIAGSPSQATEKRLLTTLSRAGGSVGADYVARYALQKQGGAAESAVDALGHWNDKTALAPLAGVAEKAPSEAFRILVIDTTITSLPQNFWELTKDDRAVIARLRALTKDRVLLARLDALENPPAK